MSQAGTSDKNFYDRCYFNAHDRTGDVFVITGLGSYVNLGVIDAYATVKLGDVVHTARFSGALGPDRMHQQVGPYRIEVLEPLQRVRVVCDGDDHGVGFDLTWEGSFPAVEEEPHVINNGYRTILQSSRFAQMGSWTGEVRAGGQTLAVEPSTWLGSRDRSWGIRPVGDADAPGRTADDAAAGGGGFWWLYVPLRFDDFQIIVMAQEKGRRLPHPQRRQAGVGRRPGRADGLAGLRHPVPLGQPPPRARHAAPDRHVREAGHGRDRHPRVRAAAAGLRATATPTGPTVSGRARTGRSRWSSTSPIPPSSPRIPFGNIDHVAHAWCDGAEGWGLFEHASIGAHAPTGFTDLMSVAP